MRKLLSKSNGKLIETGKKFNVKIFNWSLPAYKNKDGKTVCPFADVCVKYCYAKKGNYTRYPKNMEIREQKYKISKQDNFVQLMDKEIKSYRKIDYIRLHDSGDFYSPEYLKKWIDIANKNPKVKFYAYTKSHNFFRGVSLPENFDVIFSFGSKLDNKINIETERHAKIFDNETELKNAGYIDASKYDILATKFVSKNNKIGLIYH